MLSAAGTASVVNESIQRMVKGLKELARPFVSSAIRDRFLKGRRQHTHGFPRMLSSRRRQVSSPARATSTQQSTTPEREERRRMEEAQIEEYFSEKTRDRRSQDQSLTPAEAIHDFSHLMRYLNCPEIRNILSTKNHSRVHQQHFQLPESGLMRTTSVRPAIYQLIQVRNSWAHQEVIPATIALLALTNAELLIREILGCQYFSEMYHPAHKEECNCKTIVRRSIRALKGLIHGRKKLRNEYPVVVKLQTENDNLRAKLEESVAEKEALRERVNQLTRKRAERRRRFQRLRKTAKRTSEVMYKVGSLAREIEEVIRKGTTSPSSSSAAAGCGGGRQQLLLSLPSSRESSRSSSSSSSEGGRSPRLTGRKRGRKDLRFSVGQGDGNSSVQRKRRKRGTDRL